MINIQAAAERYISGKHQEPTKLELAIFAEWLDREFDKIKHMVRFTPSEVDPAQMLARLENTGQLLISSANNDSNWLTAKQNVRFRAVHDSHHVRYGLSFDAEGEYMAFEAAAAEATVLRQLEAERRERARDKAEADRKHELLEQVHRR